MRITCISRSLRVIGNNLKTTNDNYLLTILIITVCYGNLWLPGTTSSYQQSTPKPIQVEKFFGHYLHESFVTAYPRCDRFGEIQSLRTKKDGIYRLIMAAKLGKYTVKMDTVSVECRIMNSLADFELYDGANFEL